MFKPTGFQFAVHSVSRFLLRELEKRTPHVSFDRILPGDILIAGENDTENLNNLCKILSAIKKNELFLQLKKSVYD